MAIKSRLRRLEQYIGPTMIIAVLDNGKLIEPMSGKEVHEIDPEAAYVEEGRLYVDPDRVLIVKIYEGISINDLRP